MKRLEKELVTHLKFERRIDHAIAMLVIKLLFGPIGISHGAEMSEYLPPETVGSWG